VTYACLHDGCFARWIWEKQTNELHYWGEAAIVGIGERDNDERLTVFDE
jgi:hypothetical protein